MYESGVGFSTTIPAVWGQSGNTQVLIKPSDDWPVSLFVAGVCLIVAALLAIGARGWAQYIAWLGFLFFLLYLAAIGPCNAPDGWVMASPQGWLKSDWLCSVLLNPTRAAEMIIALSSVLLAGITVWATRRIVVPGHCVSCGYDLTGNVSGRCPECGVEVAATV